MKERNIVVPEGMYKAAMAFQDSGIQCDAALQAALRWLSDNPIVPTNAQYQKILDDKRDDKIIPHPIAICGEWQRRMFLAPETEVPEAVKDLIVWPEPPFDGDMYRMWGDRNIKERIAEAYRRGKESINGR